MGVESFREIIEIDPKEIKVSPYHVRKMNVKGRDWEDFKASIQATNGPLHLPIISKNKEVIVGQRRVLAAQELGIPKIRVEILEDEITEADVIKLSYIENRVRLGIDSDEELDAFSRLLEIFNSNKKIAEFLGMDPVDVSLIFSRYGIPEAKVTRKRVAKAKKEDIVNISIVVPMPDSLYRWLMKEFCKIERMSLGQAMVYAVKILKGAME